MEFDLTRGDSSSEEGSDSEPEAWWGGSQPCGEDDYDPEIAVKCALHQTMQWIVGDMQFR